MLLLAAFLLATPTSAPAGACALLTSDEVAQVQGASPEDTKATEHTDGEVTYQQCYFLLPKAAQSVSLEVRKPAPGAPKNILRQRRRKMLEPPKEEEEEREGKKKSGPIRVRGVGKAACGWARPAPAHSMSCRAAPPRASAWAALRI